MSVIKNISISFPIIPTEKMTIELTVTPEIRIPQIDGSLFLNIPTKFDTRIEANISSDIGVRGSLDVELPKDFTIDIKGLEKNVLSLPLLRWRIHGSNCDQVITYWESGHHRQCTKCHKKLQP